MPEARTEIERVREAIANADRERRAADAIENLRRGIRLGYGATAETQAELKRRFRWRVVSDKHELPGSEVRALYDALTVLYREHMAEAERYDRIATTPTDPQEPR